MKKIISIIQLPPPVHGASLMNQLFLKSKLISAQFKISHFQLSLSRNNFKESKISKLINFIFLISSLFKLKNKNADIVYITPSVSGISIVKDVIIIFVSKIIFKSKVVLHLHNYGLKKNSFIPYIIKKKVFSNTTIILNSVHLSSDIPKGFKNIKIKYCHSCLPHNYKEISSNRNSIPNILFYSNILISKGIVDFIKIIKDLEKNIKLTFTIAGDFYDYNEIELIEIIESYKICSNYKILGKINNDQKESVFNNSDIYVNPTHFETFGITILESLWFNTPVVATNIGGIPEIIKNNKNGYLVELRNINQFVESILKLLVDSDLYDKFVKNGNDIIKNKFQINNYEIQLLKIFNELN